GAVRIRSRLSRSGFGRCELPAETGSRSASPIAPPPRCPRSPPRPDLGPRYPRQAVSGVGYDQWTSMRDDGAVNTDAQGGQPHPTAESTDDRSRLYPRVTSFRFRRGALSTGQERNWERL